MVLGDGERFEAEIAPFPLAVPHAVNSTGIRGERRPADLARYAPSRMARSKPDRVATAAIPAEELAGEFPELDLPVRPPYPPMEAKPAARLPAGEGWLYEPKWDGFRCLAFREGGDGRPAVEERAAAGPLFPRDGRGPRRPAGEDASCSTARSSSRPAAGSTSTPCCSGSTRPPAASASSPARPRRAIRPSTCWWTRAAGRWPRGRSRSGARGWRSCSRSCRPADGSSLSPATPDRKIAERWMQELGGAGLDGVIAKRRDCPYRRASATGMVKVKRVRTADCVVGGFRWAQRRRNEGDRLAAARPLRRGGAARPRRLLLELHRRGARRAGADPRCRCASRPASPARRRAGPAAGARSAPTEWEPLRPKLVVRGPLRPLLRRPLPPRHQVPPLASGKERRDQCTFEQVRPRAVPLSKLGL